MSLIIPANTLASGGYEVANSLRFNDDSSDYLNRTPASAGDRNTWTYSVWIKRGNLGSGTSPAFTILSGDTTSDYGDIFRLREDKFNFRNYSNSTNYYFSDRKYRDTSAWYNFIIKYDGANSTVQLYVNGELEGSVSISLNENSTINDDEPQIIGAWQSSSPNNYFDGYMAEAVMIDGQALDPTSFGEFDEDSGIWKPIDVSGLTFGTNGFYLDFEDSGALGADVSGNTNNFTVNNLTAIDQTTDTCTNNFATWNPLWSQSNGNIGDVVFSEGNLKTTTSANYRTFPATIGFSSGKWYWEIKRYEDTADMHTGVMSELATPANTATWIGSTNNGWVFGCDGGSTYGDGVEGNTGYTAAPNAGDIVQVAFNADDGKIYFGVNGTWQNSGNPATGTNPAYTGLDTSLFYFPCASTGSDVEANFGSPSFAISSGNTDGNGYGNFEYAVPSGYYSLNTKNLSEYG